MCHCDVNRPAHSKAPLENIVAIGSIFCKVISVKEVSEQLAFPVDIAIPSNMGPAAMGLPHFLVAQ